MSEPITGQEDTVYAFGSFVADPCAGTLHHDGSPLVLSLKSFEVLMVLIEHRGRVVEKDTLFKAVWPDRIVEENNLARHISTLRKVLSDDPQHHQFIVTVPGRGYRFAAPVRCLQIEDLTRSTVHTNAPVAQAERSATSLHTRTIAAATAVVVVLIGIAVYSQLQPVPVQATERKLWQLTSSGGLESDATWDRTGRSIAYSSDRNGNLDIWVQSVNNDHGARLTSSPAHDWQPSWSPDGRFLAFRSERDGGGLFIVPATGGGERRLANFGYRPQFSPTGSAILFYGSNVTQSNLYVVDSDSLQVRDVLNDFLEAFTSFRASWHPDGKRVSVFGLHRKYGPSFWTVPLSGGAAVRSALHPQVASRLNANGITLTEFAWSPSADALYFEGRCDEAVNIFRVRVNPTTLEWQDGPERLTVGGGLDTGIGVSPDGRKLAFTVRDEKTRLWSFPFDPVAGRILGQGKPITTGGVAAVYPDISANGSQVVYRTVRRGKHELRRRSLTSGEDTVLLATSDVIGPRWSNDGTLLAFRRVWPAQPGSSIRENAIVLVSADGRNERLLTARGPREVTPFDWSSDGNSILAACEQGPTGKRSVCLLPVLSAPHAQDHMRVIASDPERNLYQATFSPNQQWIAFIATSWRAGLSTVYVVGTGGGQWTAISEGAFWDDKPRWSPDGRTIYFLSNRSGFVNVWGRRLDPVKGTPSGDPFQVTSLEAPSARVLSPLASTELAIAADRMILPIVESAGSIWVLENTNN